MNAREEALNRDLAARARLANDPVARIVMGRSVEHPVRNVVGGSGSLSPRELEALRYASRGLWPYAMIADAMGIRANTVQSHLKNARFKLGAKTNIQACCEAVRRRLIP